MSYYKSSANDAKTRKTRMKYILGVATSAIAVLVIAISTVYATSTFTLEQQTAALDGAKSKFLYSALSGCYNRMRDMITTSGTIISWSNIFENDSDDVKMPTSLYPELNDSTLKCKQLIGGWHNFFGAGGTFEGIGEDRTDIPISANGTYSSYDEVVKFLKDIGYEVDDGNEDNLIGYSCVYYHVEGEYITDKICAKVKDDGVTVDTSADIKIQTSSYIGGEDSTKNSGFTIIRWSLDGVKYDGEYLYIKKVGGHSFFASASTFWDVSNMSCDNERFKGNWEWSYETTGTACYSYAVFGTGHFKVEVKDDTFTIYDIGQALKAALYTINSEDAPSSVGEPIVTEPEQPNLTKKTDGFNDFMSFFLGDNYTKYASELTQAELYMLYYNDLTFNDLTTSFDVTVQCDYSSKPSENTSDKFGVNNWLDDTTMRQDCVVLNKSGSKTITSAQDSKPTSLTSLTVKQIVDLMNGLDINDVSFNIIDDTGDAYEYINSVSVSDDDSTLAICYEVGGSLGWILCPIIQGLSSVTQSIYDGILTGFLEVKTALFENDGYSYTAWKVFRDMANLILVFAMLAMIFSQLTGFGISTYGVKKYLPRIVAVAILVNVSFFICQLAVDVSNIVGFSLNNFLDGIASQVQDNYSYRVSEGEASFGSDVSWFSQFFGWTAILVILAVAGFLAYFMIFAVLFALLAAVVALVLMFILLGLRQAIVVIFVIISPVVVALYALPNTEKLAKQALTVFSKMLLMFPMAAALFGGASLASQIILSVTINSESDLETFDGILMYLTALIVAVVPLFFLPKLVKSSFAAAGGAFRAIAAGGILGAAAGAAQGKMRAAAGAGMQRLGATIGEKTGFSNWNNTRKAIQTQKIEQGNNRRAKDRVGKIQERLASGEPMSDRKRSRLQAQMGILGGQAAKYDQEQYDRALGSARISLAGKSNDDIVGSLRQMQKAGNLDSADAKAYAAVLTGRGGKGVEDFNSFAQSVADGGNGGDAKAMADIYYSNDVAKNTSNSVVGTTLAAQFSKEALRGSPDDPHAIGRDSNGNSIAGAAVGEKLRNASAQQWANMSDDEFKNKDNIKMMSDHVRQEFQTNANMRGSLTQAKLNALGVAAPSAGPSVSSGTPSGASETNAGSGTGGG